MHGWAAAEYDSLKIACSSLLMDRYSPRRSLYSGPNSFVDSDEVSPEIGCKMLNRFTDQLEDLRLEFVT